MTVEDMPQAQAPRLRGHEVRIAFFAPAHSYDDHCFDHIDVHAILRNVEVA